MDNEDHDDETENGCSKGRRKIAVAATIVVVLIVAIVVPVVVTQSSGGTVTPAPLPTPAAPTATPTTQSPTIPPTTLAPITPAPPPQDLVELVSSVSPDGGDALLTPEMPQYQAVNWLAGNTNLDSYSDTKKIQQYVLATFYYSKEGDTWDHQMNWLDDGEECGRWYQFYQPTLQCTESGALVQLDFSRNNLKGTLPPRLDY